MDSFQEFPKWKYHPVKDPLIVGNKEAEEALGPGWHESPAAFCSHKCETSHGMNDEFSAVPIPVKKPKKVKA